MDAPNTIAQGDTMDLFRKEEFKYKPQPKEMPKMDFLPDQLDLPGIVNYNSEQADSDFFNPSKEG